MGQIVAEAGFITAPSMTTPAVVCQRPTAAHQQRHRFPLEIIRKLTTSLRLSAPIGA
jgi:hypothetical protein